MMSWRDIVVSDSLPLIDAIKIIDKTAMQILLVGDHQGRLIGTLTDGDVRRALLKSLPMSTPVSQAMNRRPTSGRLSDPHSVHVELLKRTKVRQLPLVDEEGQIGGLVTLDEVGQTEIKRPNWVVLMAGGLGRRLQPYTNSTPKPMLAVGGKPILETVIETFVRQDFERFYISVNFQAQVLKDYFGDGRNWGAEIRYLEEPRQLGTAGALSLLDEKPRMPVLVMNGDIISTVDFRRLLDYHIESRAHATMCVREYDLQVPFGVVQVDDGRIVSIDEKPVHKFLVNAGIYVIEPDVLSLIEPNTAFDMTTLFEKAIQKSMRTSVFPIHEYWIDIGRPEDFMRANQEIGDLVGR